MSGSDPLPRLDWEELGLNPRAANALAAAGFRAPNELIGLTRRALLRLPGIGPGAYVI